jgi:dephospho-CoA kinase
MPPHQTGPNGRFSVGLTGGIGSGKTTVANLFAARGASVIDTDLIAHQLTAPGGAAMRAIASQFGAQFITPDGALDRAKMRTLVFDEKEAKRALEGILHPLISQETARQAAHAQAPYLMFVVPLLVESGTWKQRVVRVLVVDCPETVQIERVIARNGLTEAQVRAIMATQVPRQVRLAAADDIIENNSEITLLTAEIDRLHDLYLLLAK